MTRKPSKHPISLPFTQNKVWKTVTYDNDHLATYDKRELDQSIQGKNKT